MKNFMSKITDAARNLFANQTPQTSSKPFPAPNQLAGLDAPGCAFKKPAVNLPAVIAEPPAPVAPIVEQPTAATHCKECGQALPQRDSQQPASGPVVVPFVDDRDPDHAPINWGDEARTDLPMRSPKRIAFLLQHETESQRDARIVNDGFRYQARRKREGSL
jgi:hypothetical protein